MKAKLKKKRNTFRKLAKTGKLGKYIDTDIELLCQNVQLDNMTSLVNAFLVQNNEKYSEEEKTTARKLFEKNLAEVRVLKKEEKKKADELIAKYKLENRLKKEKNEKKS